MLYAINGNDLQAVFGTIITNAVPPFFQYPDRKPSEQNDFEDENGLQIDLDTPRFSARMATFNCVMSGSTILAVKNSYFGLFTLLKISGVYSIYNDFLDMTIQVYFSKQQNLKPFEKNSSGGWSIAFDLIFGETDPFANIPNVFLVDDKNRFLVP